MRLEVSEDRCTGQGRCYSVAPELLEDDDEGYVSIRGRALDVPPEQVEAARLAAKACPEGAISLL